MTFDLDQGIDRLVLSRNAPPMVRMDAFSGGSQVLRLGFVFKGNTVVLPTTREIRFGIESAGGTLLALADTWAFDPDTSRYVATLNLNTEEMVAALGDEDYIEAKAQLIWRRTDEDEPFPSQIVEVRVYRSVITFDDGTPTALPSPEAWLADKLATATSKTTPVDADTIPMSDSAAAGALKKLSFANLWTWINAKIAPLYRIKRDPVVTDATTSRDIAVADAGKHIIFTNSGAISAILFGDTWTDGDVVRITNQGTGKVTFTTDGATIIGGEYPLLPGQSVLVTVTMPSSVFHIPNYEVPVAIEVDGAPATTAGLEISGSFTLNGVSTTIPFQPKIADQNGKEAFSVTTGGFTYETRWSSDVEQWLVIKFDGPDNESPVLFILRSPTDSESIVDATGWTCDAPEGGPLVGVPTFETFVEAVAVPGQMIEDSTNDTVLRFKGVNGYLTVPQLDEDNNFRLPGIRPDYASLIARYPRRIPFLAFGGGWSNKTDAADGDYEPAYVASDGVNVSSGGFIEGPNSSVTPGGAAQFVYIPNGYVPTVNHRSATVPVVTNGGTEYLSASLIWRPDRLVELGLFDAASIAFFPNQHSMPNPANLLGQCGWSDNGDEVTVMIPQMGDQVEIDLVIYDHGAGDDHLSHLSSAGTGSSQQRMAPIIPALLDEKYWTVGFNGGAIAENWGNAAAFAALQALIAKVKTFGPVRSIKILGQSMGGLVGLRALGDIAEVTHFYGIYPACNRQAVYTSGVGDFAAKMATADGGVFSANSTTLDPMLMTLSKFAGKKFRAAASESDSIINTDNNTDAFITRITGTAASATKLTATGDHGDASAFDADDIITFFSN